MADGADAKARIAELEAELKSERVQFTLAERAAGVGYWRYRLSDKSLTCSPGMYAIFGFDQTVQQLPDNMQWFIDRLENDDARVFLDKVKTAIQTRSSCSYLNSICRAGTVEKILDSHVEVETGPDGRVIAVVGACHDVTQQVTAEAERDKVQELYRMMMEEASDIIMVFNPQGDIEFISPAFERILGQTRRIYKKELKNVHPDDRAEVQKAITSLTPEKVVTITYRSQHSDGHYVWLEAKIRNVHDETTGAFRSRVMVLRDVSERKAQELAIQAAREAAEAANRAKSTFLANMSHELRTPLNAIIGFTDVMRHEMFGPIDNLRYRDYILLIHNSGQHLLNLIGDVLDMAKIEAGKLQLNIEDMNLAETVNECVQLMAERAAHGGVSLNARMPVQGLTCSADRRAMKRIVLNLLSNAVKFTPSGGHVEIAAKLHDDLVRLEVRDDGVGIATEDLPRLAKPFEQVCVNPNLAKVGTGLGLALVRALAEQHGGRFSIESPAHKGTIVTVEFPRCAARSVVAA